MYYTVGIFLLCLITLTLSEQEYDVGIPKSFTSDHKVAALIDASYDVIQRVTSSFEVDSHIEVVLIGELFNKDYVQALKDRLEIFSMISSTSSPLPHIHEKLLYHITLGLSIQKSIAAVFQKAEQNNVVDPYAIANVLANYHARASTGTTLFILHNKVLSGGNSSYSYKTQSAYTTCLQRTFIAQDASFAWLDVSAHTHELRPAISAFPVLVSPMRDLQDGIDDHGHYLNALAALIHQSGEAFNQLPTPRSGDVSSAGTKGFVPHRNRVSILGITICVEDEDIGHSLCEHDLSVHITAQELSRMYGDVDLSFQYNSVKFGINDMPELAHAFFSSIHHSSSGSATIVDSNELLFWLSASTQMRDLIATYSSSSWQLLPVFVLKMPPSVETFLDEPGQRAVVTHMLEPAGGWRYDRAASKSKPVDAKNATPSIHLDTHRWPEMAVLCVRSMDLQAEGSDTLTSGTVNDGLPSGSDGARSNADIYCDSEILPTGTALEVFKDDLRGAVKLALWGIAPASVHYSGSAKGRVQDMLWYTPVALRRVEATEFPINTGESFADRRAVSRLHFLYRAEDVLQQLDDLLVQAAAVHPPINVTLLLEIGIRDSSFVSGARAASDMGFTKANKVSSKSKSGTSSVGQAESAKRGTGLLSRFLQYVDQSASEFSHVDFSAAHAALGGAEEVLDVLRQRLLRILGTRSGTVLCKDSGFKTAERILKGDEVDGFIKRQVDEEATWSSLVMRLAFWIVLVIAAWLAGRQARQLKLSQRKHYL